MHAPLLPLRRSWNVVASVCSAMHAPLLPLCRISARHQQDIDASVMHVAQQAAPSAGVAACRA
jgi:hypothetical protein